jgi:hypothetical protein
MVENLFSPVIDRAVPGTMIGGWERVQSGM